VPAARAVGQRAASSSSAGSRFRALMLDAQGSKKPLQIVGATSAYMGRMAQNLGYKSLYVSGGGVALMNLGVPDLGVTTLDDVLTDVRRLARVTEAPALVDIDTGFGSSIFSIERTVRDMELAGAGAVHMEDQVLAKRCGHRPNKQVVPAEEMVARLQAAKRGATDIVVMARTDALAIEGIEAAIDRAKMYVEVGGADCIFAEAVNTLEHVEKFSKALPDVPLLVNLTEFGKTPLWTVDELGERGIAMVLYPLSAFRAQSKAAESVYKAILADGTNATAEKLMHTRMQTYDVIDYMAYEKALDASQASDK
jgi:methylisocitrate lyase